MGEKKAKFLAFYFNPGIESPFKVVQKENTKTKTINDIRNVVFPGQTILRMVEEDFVDPKILDRQPYTGVTPGKNVELDKSLGLYISQIYGFAVIRGRKLEILPLTEFSKDKLTAFLYYLPNKSGRYPTLEEIRRTVVELNLKGYLQDKKIEEQIQKIKEGKKKFGLITLCKGVPPKEGQVEHFVLLQSIEKKVGTVVEGDRIDYKEQNTFTPVQQGTPILEKKPHIPAVDGYDVLGNELKGKMRGEKFFIPGRNLEESKEDTRLYVAAINGVLSIQNRKVSVENKTVIKSDIDYETGNIKIEGNVEIFGNVKSGFSVVATGDIIIHGNVEESNIIAAGNIYIDNGVLGKGKASLEAGNSIVLRFAQNTNMKAMQDILVKESLIQCRIFAKNMVHVEGTVIGGEATGKRGINVQTAGSDKGVETKLIAGKDPEIEDKVREKEEERKQIELVHNDVLEEMKMQFGNQFLIDLKGFLSILRGSRKIKFIEMLTKLGNMNKEMSRIKKEIEDLRAQLTFAKLPVISIQDKIFTDVIIQIRKSIHKVKQNRGGTVFREDPETGVIIE
jgi:uncharacterized protein (DUF342 family)